MSLNLNWLIRDVAWKQMLALGGDTHTRVDLSIYDYISFFMSVHTLNCKKHKAKNEPSGNVVNYVKWS